MADDKYQLQLTGAQVDDALQQLNQRVAEGWAVGTRDGSAVTSGSQFYHNNARYYAEQSSAHATEANAAAARAEAAVPSGTAGAVFFDRQQSLTTGQQEQARKNIGAGNSNPNLLRNWDFRKSPVNSRGKTTYSPNEYAIDGWKIWGDVYARIDPDNLALAQGGSGGGIFQYLDGSLIPSLNGKTVTFSAIINDELYSATGVFQVGAWIAATTDIIGASIVFVYPVEYPTEYISVSVRCETTLAQTIAVKAIKLELGSYSTLLQDAPADYSEELAKCIYSKAYPPDTYANTGFGRSNENLLDNWYFVGAGSQAGDGNFPINQRGGNTYSGTQIGFDRWHTFSYSGAMSATLTGSGIQLHFGANGADEFAQIIPSNRMMEGETYTFTVQYQSGDIRTLTFVFSSSTIIQSADQFRFHIIPSWGGGTFFAILNLNANARDLYVRAVKLEKGTVSTLANDPPPDFGEELRKCQRYYTRLSFGQYVTLGMAVAEDSGTLLSMINLPVLMRAIPTNITWNSVAAYDYTTGTYYTPTTIFAIRGGNTTPILSLWTGVNASMTGGRYMKFCATDAGYIEFSAEL